MNPQLISILVQSHTNGCPNSLRALFQDPEVWDQFNPVDVQHVSLRPALVHIRVQVLQVQDLPRLYQPLLDEKVNLTSNFTDIKGH